MEYFTTMRMNQLILHASIWTNFKMILREKQVAKGSETNIAPLPLFLVPLFYKEHEMILYPCSFEVRCDEEMCFV